MADLSITAANVLASATARTVTGVAGATITAGQPLYIDTADGNALKPAQNTSTKSAFVGIALHAAADGQPITYCSRDEDFTIGATVAVGQVYILSDNAGGIAPISDAGSGDFIVVVGIGKSTTKIKTLADAVLRADAAKA